MNKKKISKRLILVFLIAVPTAMLFGFMITNVKAENPEPYIPVTDYRNNWQWNDTVEEGDMLIYEMTYIKQNVSGSGEGDIARKSNYIINITSIANETVVWDIPNIRIMSQINATECYFDPRTSEMIAYDEDPWRIAAFQYNVTDEEEVFFINERLPIPFIVPFNSTLDNDMNTLANTLNETFYYPMYSFGKTYNPEHIPLINKWNAITTSGIRTMRFDNNTGYFAEFRYLLNGTLDYGEMYFEQLQGDVLTSTRDDLFIVNITLKRIFDPDIVSEVEWDVNPGETFYIGINDINNEGSDFDEVKIDIVEIKTILDNEMGLAFFIESGDPITFLQEVIANISIWDNNTRRYVLDDENATIAVANNYHPFLMELGIVVLFPKNVELEDVEWIIEFYKINQGSEFPFDDNSISEADGRINILLNDTSSGDNVRLIVNKTSGMIILHLLNMDDGNEFSILYSKDKKVIKNKYYLPLESDFGSLFKWSVNISVDYPNDLDLYWALSPYNLVNESIYDWMALPEEFQFFMDLYTNDSAAINNETTKIKLYYDTGLETYINSIDRKETDLMVFYYEGGWKPLPPFYFEVNNDSNYLEIWPCKDVFDTNESIVFTIALCAAADTDYTVEVGDVIYYGSWMSMVTPNEGVREWRIIISGISISEPINMTEALNLGTPYTGPGPEIQCFGYILADIEIWDNATKSWVLDESDFLIAISNNYYPIIPYELYEALGIDQLAFYFVPIGTTLQQICDVFQGGFPGYSNAPVVNAQEGCIEFTNSSKSLKLYYNESTGFLKSIVGWMYMDGEWGFFSNFLMYIKTIQDGVNIFDLESDLIGDITVSVNVTAASPLSDTRLFYGLTKDSPVNISIANALFYMNFLINQSAQIQNITIYIQLPASYNLATMTILPYAYICDEDGGVWYWEGGLPEGMQWSDFIIIDSGGNNITIIFPFPPGMDIDFLIAIGYSVPSPPSDGDGDGKKKKKAEAIPGFNLYLLIGGLSLISLALVLKRRKIIELL